MTMQTPFFMNRADLIDLLCAVEKVETLTYVRCGAFVEDEDIDRFETGLDIPWLGKATKDRSSGCDTFLVVPRDVDVALRRVHGRVVVDQLVNPDSVTFTGAGMHRSGVMLFGRVATAYSSPLTRRLMNRFRSVLRRQCKRIKAFYVGPEAEKLWLGGTRLTVALQSAPEFDLSATWRLLSPVGAGNVAPCASRSP